MKAIILFIFLALLLFLLYPKWYLKNKAAEVTNTEVALLRSLGDSALAAGDVPVAAILVYDNKILGKGYNTVKQNSCAGGHAEINAITDAMRLLGADSFMHINRARLLLISTWEPCMMCRGAISEYNIQHVVIMKTKSMRHWLKQWEKVLKYEWNKQATINDTLFSHLFMKHPAYGQQKDNF